jgi:hypothetical protein
MEERKNDDFCYSTISRVPKHPVQLAAGSAFASVLCHQSTTSFKKQNAIVAFGSNVGRSSRTLTKEMTSHDYGSLLLLRGGFLLRENRTRFGVN